MGEWVKDRERAMALKREIKPQVSKSKKNRLNSKLCFSQELVLLSNPIQIRWPIEIASVCACTGFTHRGNTSKRTVEQLVPGTYVSVMNLFSVKAYSVKQLILAAKSQAVEIIKVTPK